MADIKIKGVKLVKAKKKQPEKLGLVYVETKETKEGKSHHYRDEECDAPPHQDLKTALSGLCVHLALLTDYVTEKNARNKESIEPFHVTGYSLSGEDDDNVIITGYRNTKRGTAVILNSPLFKMQESDDNPYMLIKHLESQIDLCNNEVLLYLIEGKRAPDMQTEMAFPDNGQEED